jgi:phosphatidate cytidylyltransferase
MKRILTAAIGIPVVVLVVLYTSDRFLALAVAIAGARCLSEFLDLAAVRLNSKPGGWIFLVSVVVTVSFSGGIASAAMTLPFAILIVTALIMFASPGTDAFPKLAAATLGLFYCSFLLGFMLLVRRELIVVLLGILWIGDAAAYYGGSYLGRHPLAPRISPRKTVEGAFAGLIGSVIAGVILGAWVAEASSAPLVSASIATAGAGQLGDLVESAMKRSAGVKDSSELLPGHGGLLDRLDGLLFAAPVYYWFFMQ